MTDAMIAALIAFAGGLCVGISGVLLYAQIKWESAQMEKWERRNLDSRADEELDRALRRAGL